MPAPTGNQFWKIRSRHGRNKLFATPELLWEAACEYFEWCDQNPLIQIDFKGKDAEQVEMPKMRPYTIQGLCLYLDCNVAYFRTFKAQIKKEDEQYQGFNTVITRIEETIYNQKFSGAAAGFLNPMIISRDLGLKEQTDITTDGEKIKGATIDLAALPTDVLKGLLGSEGEATGADDNG